MTAPWGAAGSSPQHELLCIEKRPDNVFESFGVKVFVDPKSLAYIDGTELDFAREGLNEGFRFNNPNVKDNCGCGESFRI